MNTAEFLKSLTTEQANACATFRDELMAANAKTTDEIGRVHLEEQAKKDAALDAANQAADKLAAEHADALAKRDEEHAAAIDALAATLADHDTQLKSLTVERDTTLSRIKELESYCQSEPKVVTARLAALMGQKLAVQAQIDALAQIDENMG